MKEHLKIAIIVLLILAALGAGLFNLTFEELLQLSVVRVYLEGESFIEGMLAALATITAIYFSISVLAVQHAATNYTASILEYYKRDLDNWLVYTLLCSGLYLSSMMLIGRASILVLDSGKTISLLNFGFVILISSFAVLAMQFVHLFDLVNPKRIAENAKQRCFSEIEKAPSRVTSILKRIKAETEVERKWMQSRLYRDFLFHKYQSTVLRPCYEKVLQIADIVSKSSIKREAETYAAGLAALSDVAQKYVSIRRDDTSQEDDFLGDIYGKLVSTSKIAFDNEDLSLLQEIIRTLERIGIATVEIRPISEFSGPNQATGLAIIHARDLGMRAAQKLLWDGTAQSVRSIHKIGIAAIQKTRHGSLAPSSILDLGKIAAKCREWFVPYVALGTLGELLFHSVRAKAPIHGDPMEILDAIEQLSLSALEQGLGHLALASLFPIMPEESLVKIVYAVLDVKNEPYPSIETRGREKYAKEIVSELLEALGKIGSEAAKRDSPIALGRIVDCIDEITVVLIGEKFKTFSNGFHEELLEAVGALSGTYIFRTGAVMPWFVWDGAETLTTLAFQSLDAARDEIAGRCVESLLNVSVKLVKLDKYGYEPPRIASRIAIIGSYALHKANSTFAKLCVDDLVKFDKAYLADSPAPHDRRHTQDMRAVHKQLHNGAIIRDEKWNESYIEVTPTDLDNFEELYEETRGKIKK